MTDSKKKVAGKTASATVAKPSSKSASPPDVSGKDVEPPKRRVMTSSEIEAAAKGAVKSDKPSVTASSGAATSGAATPKAEQAPKASSSSLAPKQATPAKKSSIAKPGAARPDDVEKPSEPKSTAPASSTKSEKANTVSTKSKSATSSKSAAPKKTTAAKAAPKKAAAAPASTASKSAPAPKAATPAKSAAPAATKPVSQPAAKPAPAKSVADPKPADAKPKAEAKKGDVFGFGALFVDGTGMEPYFELWKTPEVEAMVSAGNDAFEDSVSAANEAFGKIFETMTGQADVFSGAGSRVAAQYEELLDTQKKSFEEVWQATMAMFEKTGGIGTELSSWMQKEFEASQDDLDELTKVESIADLQDLHTRIINRCYANSMAEGEKMQELMFAAISDGLDAISKATNVTMK